MKRRGLTLLELLVVLTILIALGTIVIPSLGYLGQRSQRLATRENLARLQKLLVDRYFVDMNELPRPALDADGNVIETNDEDEERSDHPQLCYLFVNPDAMTDADQYNDRDRGENLLSGRCWQGPYVRHQGAEYALDAERGFDRTYGEEGDPTVYDAWGHPVVLQVPTEVPTGYTVGDDDAQIARIQLQHARLVSAGEDGAIDTPTDVLMPDSSDDPATGRDDDIVVFLFRHDEHGEGYLDLSQEP